LEQTTWRLTFPRHFLSTHKQLEFTGLVSCNKTASINSCNSISNKVKGV